MELEIVTIGNELLLGYTLDTNAAELSRALAAAGVRVTRISIVGDDPAAIERAVRQGLARTGFVVTTGGLGPTPDDLTKPAIAGMFDAPLELDTDYLAQLQRRFERLGRGPMPATNRTQAEVPRGATMLPNRRGTAPGLWLEGPLGSVVMLPGVPQEVRGLIPEQLLPRLEAKTRAAAGSRVTRSRVLRTTGLSESGLAQLLEGIETRLAPATLAYLPGLEGVDLRLTVWNHPVADADRALDAGARTLQQALGQRCYGEEREDLAAIVLALLSQRSQRLAVAESCTGGLVSERITRIPGSSHVFAGGIVSYADEVKIAALGVGAEILERHGAVSESVAGQMARGVAKRLAVEVGVAVTGIAGPGGGSPDKPVGTVWLAAWIEGRERARKRVFPGGRDDIRQRSAQAALDLLRHMMLDG